MGISLSGVGSGFDWQSLIDQLTQAEQQQRIDPLTSRKTKYQDKLTAWQSLGSKLAALQTAAENLKDSNDYDVFKATLTSSSTTSADSLLSVSMGSGVTGGRYEIKIDHVAKSQKIQSSSVGSQNIDTGWTGSISVEGHEISLDGKSLQSLRDEINALNTGSSPSGVVATILQVANNDYRFVLTHQATGAAGMSLTDNSAGHNFSIENPPGTYTLNTLQAGVDAAFSVDGISMSRSSNTITDAIAGLTLNLKSGDASSTVNLDVGQDTDAIKTKIQTFVDAYNQILDYSDQQMSYDVTKSKTGGALFGDNTLKSIKSSLQNILLNAGLYSAGITVDNKNRLSLDPEKLHSALQTDPNGTVSLFNNMAQNLGNSLKTFTDSIDGTVTLQENSLKTGMDQIDKKVTDTQALIDRKMELLKTQYINLDSALTQMKAQQSYLTSQLSSLSSSG